MTTQSPPPFPMPPSVPPGMRLELSRGRLLPGAQQETERWMGMLHERYEECLDTLGGERMAFEATFRHTEADGSEWLYHLQLHGEDGGGLDLSNPVDAEHQAYAMRCKEPGWEELRPVLLLVPRPVRPVLEAWARDGDAPTGPACSFCGTGPDAVGRLIAGPGVWICDGCVRACSGILDQVDPPPAPEPPRDQPATEQGPPDEVMAAIAVAQQAALSGERERARGLFAELWARVGEDGDPLHRMTLAHFMADLQDDPAQELEWDLRALAAADVLTDDRAGAFQPSLAVRGMRASLHGSLAADYEKLGRLAEAREQLALAEAAVPDLPEGGYGELVRSVIRDLRDRLPPV